MQENFRKILVPSPTDDLLDSFGASMDGLLVATVCESSADARTIVAANLDKISSATPMMFLIHGILYWHDSVQFHPVNEPEFYPTTRTNSTTLSLPLDQYSALISFKLPKKDYKRRISANGSVYGQVLSGTAAMRMEIKAGSTIVRYNEAKFADNATGGDNQSMSIAAEVPAGVIPEVSVGYIGTRTGVTSQVKTSVDKDFNFLDISADPVSME